MKIPLAGVSRDGEEITLYLVVDDLTSEMTGIEFSKHEGKVILDYQHNKVAEARITEEKIANTKEEVIVLPKGLKFEKNDIAASFSVVW